MAHESTRFNSDWLVLATSPSHRPGGWRLLYYYFTHYHTDQRDATRRYCGWKPLFTDTLLKPSITIFAGLPVWQLLFSSVCIFISISNTVIWLAALGGRCYLLHSPHAARMERAGDLCDLRPVGLVGMYSCSPGRFNHTVLASLPGAFLVTLVAYLKSARFDIQESQAECRIDVNVNSIRGWPVWPTPR
jgi:hypothetical protein